MNDLVDDMKKTQALLCKGPRERRLVCPLDGCEIELRDAKYHGECGATFATLAELVPEQPK